MSKNKRGQVTIEDGDSLAEDQRKEFIIPKDATVDVPVTVISLAADPYHEDGAEFQVGKKSAERMVKNGWVSIKPEENEEE